MGQTAETTGLPPAEAAISTHLLLFSQPASSQLKGQPGAAGCAAKSNAAAKNDATRDEKIHERNFGV